MNRFIIIVLLLITNSLLALEPVILTEAVGEYPLGLYLEILEDKEGKLTIDDVQKQEMETLWVKSKTEVPNFGFTKSIYWARFKIESQIQKDLFLEIAYPHLDKIDFHILSNEKIISSKNSGDHLPFNERYLQYRNFVFLVIPLEEPNTIYYFRFESESSMQFPTVLWSPNAFAEKKITEMIVLGLYFGVMMVMMLYNLFVWMSVRDKSYFYYVGYILFSAIYISNYQGLTFQYFWVGSPLLYNQLFPSFLYLPFVFMLTFTANFLHVKENLPFFNKINIFLFINFILGSILSIFLSYRSGMIFAIILIILSCIWMISVGVIMVKRNYRPARFYLFAWITFLLGVVGFALKGLGILPKNNFTEYSMQIGSALEVILLSLGLADRINDLKKQNDIAQANTLEAERRSSKIKDEFLSNLSHELKTPLSVVYAYSEMLTTSDVNPEKVKKYSGKIYDNAHKLSDYVSDLILISDIESNLQLQKSKFNLQRLITSAVEQYKPLLQEKEIHLFFNTEQSVEIGQSVEADQTVEAIHELPLREEIICDPILLGKAISAIIKNAIVYNKQGGKIIVEIQNVGIGQFVGTGSDLFLQIKIADTGIGIAKEYHEKIFEKFFRVDSALTYEVSGVGVGLFIAKKLIELHEGSIEVKSEVGIGSGFTISLPVSEKES